MPNMRKRKVDSRIPPGWEMSYSEHLERSESELLRLTQIHRTCACPKDVHKHQPIAFACSHVIEQDTVNPIGIVRMPKGYFLCKKCLDLLERKRLHFVYEVSTTCSACVWDEITRLIQLDPGKFQDRLEPGTLSTSVPIKA